MQAAQISPNIRYISLDDKDGDFGILIVHLNGYVYHTTEVYSRDDFKAKYNELQEIYGGELVA